MTQRFTSSAVLLLAVAACSTPAREGGLGPAPVITGIQISPDTVTLQRGDSVALDVMAIMSDSSTSHVPVGWVATGGTLGAGGYYHAGNVRGPYLIIASTAQFKFVDTVRVVIR